MITEAALVSTVRCGSDTQQPGTAEMPNDSLITVCGDVVRLIDDDVSEVIWSPLRAATHEGLDGSNDHLGISIANAVCTLQGRLESSGGL